jgi:hypothetical protein
MEMICYNVPVKKTRRKKHLIVQIEAIDLGDGEYYLDTTQLSDLDIPLTQFEIESSKSAGKNLMPKHELKKAIAEQKKYIQDLAQVLHWDVTIKVKKS